jgi:hypothetical protein
LNKKEERKKEKENYFLRSEEEGKGEGRENRCLPYEEHFPPLLFPPLSVCLLFLFL